MKAVKKSSDKVVPPNGTHIALLTQIIDWGTVKDSFGERQKVELVFELPEERHEFKEGEGEQPLIVTRKFANTISKNAALKDAIEGIMGITLEDDEYELEDMLGKACQLQIVVKDDGEYKNVEIQSYMQLSKSDAKRKFVAEGETFVFDLGNFDEATWKLLPEWKQTEIAKSPEYKALNRKVAVSAKPTAQPVASKPAQQKASGKDLLRKGGKK